ncbi:hypothetical protein [Odoribacter sp. AF15-53]|jgi:hypothetical protein|uniref:hypothetical protein n=1 Tax=Odoribacter sp. AF15-53 TaxID=2292236 RepID=UPI000E4667A5|nr:hypothetical protein [Odoribacter sp. AF15-53]RHR77716.1 hypothetical protein DWW52_13665 [Odoribacter sp. AF15-53]
MKNELLGRMKTMLFLLGTVLFFGSFVGDDEYIAFTCPDGLAYDVEIDACVPDADGKGLVCIIKKVKTGKIIFACDPKGEKDNCRTDSWGHELSCPNATIVIPN